MRRILRCASNENSSLLAFHFFAWIPAPFFIIFHFHPQSILVIQPCWIEQFLSNFEIPYSRINPLDLRFYMRFWRIFCFISWIFQGNLFFCKIFSRWISKVCFQKVNPYDAASVSRQYFNISDLARACLSSTTASNPDSAILITSDITDPTSLVAWLPMPFFRSDVGTKAFRKDASEVHFVIFQRERKQIADFNFRPPSQATPEIAPSYSPNESVSPDISLEPTTPDPILTPDPVIEFIPNGNAYPEANSPCQMTNGHGSMLDFTAPVRSGSGILERRLTETPDEGVRSQSSSLSPSIEQVSPSRIIGYHVLFYLLCYRYHHLVWLLWTPAGKLLSNIKLSVCVLLAEVRQLACHFSAPPCFCLISLSSYLFYLPSEKRARVTTVVKRKEIEISRGICAFSGF